MKPVEDATPFGTDGWNSQLGDVSTGWRDKDYVQLSSLFRLDRLKGTLLDVGCAVGDGFPILQRSSGAIQIEGCDFSREGVAAASERFPTIKSFVHDVHDPFPARWDSIICLQTLEHLDDPHRALANLAAAAIDTLIVASPYLNRRPDADHRWSFDETDFSDVFDTWLLDRPQRNIYWFRSSTTALARHPLGVRVNGVAGGIRRRLRRRLG